MSEGELGPRDSFAEGLVEAARRERPLEGARGRALAAVLPELSLAVAEAEEGMPSEPSRTWSRMVVGGWAAALLAACFAFVVVLHQQREAAALLAVQAADLAAQEAETHRLVLALQAQTDSVATLQSAVQSAKDDVARAAALAQLDDARRRQEAVGAALRAEALAPVRPAAAGGSSAGVRRAKPACNCTPGDPLCSCIP